MINIVFALCDDNHKTCTANDDELELSCQGTKHFNEFTFKFRGCHSSFYEQYKVGNVYNVGIKDIPVRKQKNCCRVKLLLVRFDLVILSL